MGRLHAYGLSALLIGLAAYPALLDPSEDGYPLSTYPMFSQHRPRTNEVASALAIGGATEALIPAAYVANSEPMQAVSTLRKTLRAGRRASNALCRDIAARLRSSGDRDFRFASHVELVTERVDSIDFLAGRATPEARRVHARCAIGAAP